MTYGCDRVATGKGVSFGLPKASCLLCCYNYEEKHKKILELRGLSVEKLKSYENNFTFITFLTFSFFQREKKILLAFLSSCWEYDVTYNGG